MGTVLKLIFGALGAQLLKWELGGILGIHMEMYVYSLFVTFYSNISIQFRSVTLLS
jgi:hypothetical protein